MWLPYIFSQLLNEYVKKNAKRREPVNFQDCSEDAEFQKLLNLNEAGLKAKIIAFTKNSKNKKTKAGKLFAKYIKNAKNTKTLDKKLKKLNAKKMGLFLEEVTVLGLENRVLRDLTLSCSDTLDTFSALYAAEQLLFMKHSNTVCYFISLLEYPTKTLSQALETLGAMVDREDNMAQVNLSSSAKLLSHDYISPSQSYMF